MMFEREQVLMTQGMKNWGFIPTAVHGADTTLPTDVKYPLQTVM